MNIDIRYLNIPVLFPAPSPLQFQNKHSVHLSGLIHKKMTGDSGQKCKSRLNEETAFLC